MQPGSLIFLVIVAVWAVYLVQHWIRRREHLATARSVDRFSDAMRVLERRASPVGLASVDVASVRAPVARPSLVGGRSGPSAQVRPVDGPRAPGAARRAPSGRPGPLARRVRGAVVLIAVASVPVTLLLSAVGVLPWVSVPVALGALVVTVAWLRASVRRQQAVHRAARVAQRRRVRPPRPASAPAASATPAPAVRVARPAAVVAPEVAPADVERVEQVEQVGQAGTPEEPCEVAALADPGVYDLHAVDAAARAEAAARLSAQGWSPVPVPTPTYMLKDSAPRPVHAAELSLVPVPIEVEDDELEQLMAARHRRVVG